MVRGNDYCPGGTSCSSDQVPSGCVAVAMGQVMYYWEHPSQGSGYSQYYDPEYGIISVVFSDFEYNFNNAEENGIIRPSVTPSVFELKNPTRDIYGKVI